MKKHKNDTRRFEAEEASHCGRLDKALVFLCPDFSRSRLQGLIDDGAVSVNGKVCRTPSRKIAIGDVVQLDVPPPEEADPAPENIALEILHEDGDVLVINKPAGLVVHPGAGNREGTLVNALLHHCKGSLSGIGGVMRPGIVHRLDKETSGLMAVAKNDLAHRGLAAQLEDRSLSRLYKALVFKMPFPARGVIDKPLARHPSHRLKMAVRKTGKAARTFYRVEKNFHDSCALVECKLESGRTHQIRVHMESLGHPLIGDSLYGPQKNGVRSALEKGGYGEDAIRAVLAFPRQALHAGHIAFIHPGTGQPMAFSAPLPRDIGNLLKLLDI